MEQEEKREEEMAQTPQTPPQIPEDAKPEAPEIPDEAKIESEWAEKLGMEYNPESFEGPDQVPAPDTMDGPQPMAGMQVPPAYGVPGAAMYNAGQQPVEPMPPTYMLWAILSTICCCLPAGIVAIIFSAQVSSRYFARDYEGAKRASRNAEIWIIVSIVAGIIVNALYMPLSFLMSAGM